MNKTEFHGTNIIPTEFNTNSTFNTSVINNTSHIPITIKTKGVIPTGYGHMARDAFLKLQLDNEAGNYLTLEQQENKVILSLFSKTGQLLNSVELNNELPDRLGVQDKYLYIDVNGNLVWQEGTSGQGDVKIKYDTVAGWNSQPYLRSLRGTLYVYIDKDYIDNPDGTRTYIPGLKIGDNNAYLIDKPFITDAVEYKLVNHMNDLLSHVSAEDRRRWDNKLNCIDPVVLDDLLEFTRD